MSKFHEDWAKNVSSRLFTCFHYILKRKRSPPCGHVDLPIQTIFELNCRIQETNVLTKFHDDWAKNVSSRLFTCFHYIHVEKTAPSPGGHVFPPIMTIFELVRDIYKIDSKNVTSRVKMTPLQPCFLPIRTIFKLNRHIQKTHVLTIFHEDWTKNVTSRVITCFHYIHIKKTAPPPGGHVFSPIWIIFELVRYINKTNVLNKFHDDWAKIVTSSVFKRNTAPPLTAIFELSRGINGTNVLTKFHEDQTINVASRVFTRQNVDDGRLTTDKRRSQSSP
ncbi:hypothetical protein DPMN_109720 [Dreissena polymorpha]|uniref:Uncharacterized protein n=1 Tax=Dreissena polymorpha TaxID=45954 RepID=A0A9D4KB91_DREPO|nr:hypothetical protein DPMN_109720 [Dreissena polymorpha]